MMHYVWLYEGPQWKQKAMAAAVVVGIFAVVLFPLWPIMLRQAVWYLSVGMMGLLGLFFAMSIFRLILFCVTVFVVPPGLWLFPNLFEDVGFIDSFKPLWGWQEVRYTLSLASLFISSTNQYDPCRRRKRSPRSPQPRATRKLPRPKKDPNPQQQLNPQPQPPPPLPQRQTRIPNPLQRRERNPNAILLHGWKKQKRSEMGYYFFPSSFLPLSHLLAVAPFLSSLDA